MNTKLITLNNLVTKMMFQPKCPLLAKYIFIPKSENAKPKSKPKWTDS